MISQGSRTINESVIRRCPWMGTMERNSSGLLEKLMTNFAEEREGLGWNWMKLARRKRTQGKSGRNRRELENIGEK